MSTEAAVALMYGNPIPYQREQDYSRLVDRAHDPRIPNAELARLVEEFVQQWPDYEVIARYWVSEREKVLSQDAWVRYRERLFRAIYGQPEPGISPEPNWMGYLSFPTDTMALPADTKSVLIRLLQTRWSPGWEAAFM